MKTALHYPQCFEQWARHYVFVVSMNMARIGIEGHNEICRGEKYTEHPSELHDYFRDLVHYGAPYSLYQTPSSGLLLSALASHGLHWSHDHDHGSHLYSGLV